MMINVVSSSFHDNCRYPFYASEIFNSEATDITNMFFTMKPTKEAEKVSETTEDMQTGQKETSPTYVSEPLPEEPQEVEKKMEEQKGEVAQAEESKPETKGDEGKEAEQAVEEKTTEKLPEKQETVEAETKKVTEEKPEEEAAKSEELAEEQKLKQENEKKETAEIAAKTVEETNEAKVAPKPEDQADDEDNVIQEEPSEEKNVPKGRYGLLEKLLSFLSADSEINPVLAGYFSRVMQAIIEKRKLNLLEYIFLYKEHMSNLVKHSYNKSISDVLNKILSNEDKFITGTTGEEFVSEKQNLLSEMIKKMEPNNTGDDIINNCSILCALIDAKQYLDYLLSKEVIDTIFRLSTSGNPMSLRAGLTLIIVAIRTKISSDSASGSDVFGFSNSPGIFYNHFNRDKEGSKD